MVRYFVFISLLWASSVATETVMAQTTGELEGRIIDEDTEEAMMFAAVVLFKEDVQISTTTSDINGNYYFSAIEAGTYDLVVQVINYPSKRIKGIAIVPDKGRRLDISMSSSVDIEEVVIEAEKPIICQCAPHDVIPEEDIRKNPEISLGASMVSISTINATDAGEDVDGPGRRTGQAYYVDGVLTNRASINMLDVESINVFTTGIPARYGNATGFIANIITKGPTSKFSGGLQAETSQFLDNFGEHNLNLFLSGPILSQKMFNGLGEPVLEKDGTQKKRPILGYRFSGSYNTSLDNRPSALGTFRLKEEAMQQVTENPIIQNPNGVGQVFTADFLTADDLEKTNVRSNARSSMAQYTAKIDYKPSEQIFVTIGSQGQFNWGKVASISNQLFNYNYNPDQRSNEWRVSARLRHSFPGTKPGNEEEDDKAVTIPVFQNFSYELQADYSETNFEREDPRYKNRFWEYGYVGKFYESRVPVTGAVDSTPILNSISDTIGWDVALGHQAYYNSFDRYEADWTINPGLAAYNQHILQPDLTNPNAPTSINEMEIVNGLITGGRESVYGIFNAPHLNNSSYRKAQTAQIRANVRAYFDLVTNQGGDPMRHKIEIGALFEQRIERNYSIDPFGLWNLAYQSVNNHISNATDMERPTGETYFDPITQRNYDVYEALIRKDENGNQVPMTAFAENIRNALDKEAKDWVNVHELNPSDMRLDWFEPTTLITGRQRVISYYGYDYLGNKTTVGTSFNEFFTATDAQGRKTRPVAPNKPIYAAGYIQDKFTYKDIICRFGVRFDSYDANTSVLKDPYSITGYETAAEFEGTSSRYETGQSTEYNRPSNIGDDYAVYVSANTRDAAVVGYREGEQWYNAAGLPVNNSSELGSSFVPALKGIGTAETDPQGNDYNPDDAFRDYTPTLVVMPRISLSFPISKEANFYASYDVLAQRPSSGAFATPYDYYNFREIVTSGGLINNPNLRPERTVNYEVGYQQALSKRSKIEVSLLYREDRDMIQQRQYINAYPVTYTTYGNDDFATTKAFKLEYEMRRTKNLRVVANYALQFAEGTGSNPNSSAGVAAAELKNVFALDDDQRHTFYALIDYRFGSGDKYDGPKIKQFDVLENTGLAVTINANSGRPFTKKSIPGGIGTSFDSRITEGSINGARKPWNFRVSMRIDRDFVIGKKSKNPIKVNVYLRIQNLFNTQNVLNVYPTTGSPTDDGFLNNQNGPGPGFAASQPASYQMLYDLRASNPYNISRPRRIFIGASFHF